MTGWGSTGTWNVCMEEDATEPGDWEQISDENGQWCASMYKNYADSNCRQACADDDACGAYTQYSSGWCQLIGAECTEWRLASDSSAKSWRKAVENESTCLTASTADNRQYDTIFSQELGSLKAVTFTVLASNDAHVGFFSSSKSLSEVYEIVIGGWSNSKSVIRKSNQGTNQVEASTSNIVSSSEAKQFWASASNGLVQFGHGSVIGEQTILSWQDPNPHEAVFIGVMTGWGSTGTWNVCMEEDATEPDVVAPDAPTDCSQETRDAAQKWEALVESLSGSLTLTSERRSLKDVNDVFEALMDSMHSGEILNVKY